MALPKVLCLIGILLIQQSLCETLGRSALKALGARIRQTKEELELLVKVSNEGEDEDAGRSGIKDKIKEICSCTSATQCSCCMKPPINIPLFGSSLVPTVCATAVVETNNQLLNLDIGFGSFSVFKKGVSFAPLTKSCKLIENPKIKGVELQNIEACVSMDVKESADKGLSACIKLDLKIMKVMEKSLLFPCVNFKDMKLTIDENFDGYQEEGIQLNIKDWWNKVFGNKNKNPE